MGNLTQFIPLYLITALYIVPAFQLLRRTGKSWWWAILLIWPIVGLIILLWVVAFTRWRTVPAGARDIVAVFD